MPEKKDFQTEFNEWADQQFPEGTSQSVIAHLKREIDELGKEEPGTAAFAEEAADCYMLLLHLAHKNGFDLKHEALKKHQINLKRTWGEPDHEGIRSHTDPPNDQ